MVELIDISCLVQSSWTIFTHKKLLTKFHYSLCNKRNWAFVYTSLRISVDLISEEASNSFSLEQNIFVSSSPRIRGKGRTDLYNVTII